MFFSVDIVVNRIINEDIDHVDKPTTTRKLKYPCTICCKSVMTNQKAIECDSCKLWAHIKCDGTSNQVYESMLDNMMEFGCATQTLWYCLVCKGPS